jgi:hypothetical protein
VLYQSRATGPIKNGYLGSVNPADDHDLECSEDVRSQILFIAKKLLGDQISAIAASRELSPLRHQVSKEIAEVLIVFTTIDSETDTLPIGEVRQHWTPEALKHKDREITEAENLYRDAAREAADHLLRLLEVPS